MTESTLEQTAGNVGKVEAPPPFRIGVPKEVHPGERRVAAVPATVAKLRKLGFEVLVETGAGKAAGFYDGSYVESGARIVEKAESIWAESDMVLKVRPPMHDPATGRHEADGIREGAKLLSFIWPGQNQDLVDRLAKRRATVLAMDAVPRITRAQKLDALSAMANIAGYKAVIEAANRFGRFLGGQMTAAGRVKPAQVLVIGGGVAGLAAVATAKSLGAVVKAFDVRAAVREQIESLGGIFIELEFDEKGEGAGGYAKEMSEAFLKAEQELLALHAKDSDIVICTALIPGKPAPVLLTSGAVVGMKPGSVIVDLAAEQGGNCALTERDKIVEKYRVTIVGTSDLTSLMAAQSSELYAATVLHAVEDMASDGKVTVDLEDEVQRGMLVLHDGKLMWPPPKPEIRAAAPLPETMRAEQAPPAPTKASPWPMRLGMTALAAFLAVLGIWAPPDLLMHLTVFLLAIIVGWHVIWNVTPALHTPLMSVTNAISGIIVIGGMLLTVHRDLDAATWLGFVAVLVAAINCAGGFLVTQRMLKMFRK